MWASEPPARQALYLYALLSIPQLVFAIWPGLDLWASGLFYDGASFPLADMAALRLVREVVWAASVGLFLAVLPCWAYAATGRRPLVPPRVWGLIVALYLLGPALLVNGILKEYWHRARPSATGPFGGDVAFTPAFQMSGPCDGNCAFVSGEGAGAVTAALAILWLLPALYDLRARRIIAACALSFAAAGLLGRLATGRHFLSDTVFAVLFMLAIWSALSRWLPPGWSPLRALRGLDAAPRGH